MQNTYRTSHLEANKGISYHASFQNNPYRAMVWDHEQTILKKILSKFYNDIDIRHLDFACGTGRILSYLEHQAQTSVGVDLSPAMLEIASVNTQGAEIIQGDLTTNDVLQDRRFNLVTAFRFFSNAEVSLRREAIQVLAKHLDKDGYLVFNNHKNTGCIRNRLAQLFGRKGYQGMSFAEVRSLVDEAGLDIVKVYTLCVFPASEKHLMLPVFILSPIETVLSRMRFLHGFGENLIYVCQKDTNI